MRPISFSLLLFVLGAFSAQAAVQPNTIFADHMVLQRQLPIVVWGTAGDNEQVSVELKGPGGDQTVSTTAVGGKWQVKLPPFQAGGPYTMTITGQNKIEINDVLIGEVWLCSGQSNMERQLGPRPPQPEVVDWEKEVAAANYPQIRQYYVNQTKGEQNTPSASVSGSWAICSPQTAANFTSVGYFFARDLQEKLHVPVGIIHSSLGGTPVKAWTSREAMLADPELKKIFDKEDLDVSVKKWNADMADYKAKEPALLDQYNKDLATATQAGTPPPRKPEPPRNPASFWTPSVLYNGMIAPLEPYAIRGVVWYQGESDSGAGAPVYERNFHAMIADWRKAWGEGNFPFLFVQIAPCGAWDPAIREAQLLAWQKTPNTAMVVTTDIGSTDMHPPHKQIVGERLVLAARALVYGEKTLEYSGPTYKSVTYNGNKAILDFTHLDGGLMAKDGDLKGFEISADGKTFVPAKAEIQGNTVEVSADQVANPQAVRFGWNSIPDVNLFNKIGLPASPFCTNPAPE
jgi:sialate O-acetylesterase